jgi:septal ring factor EnvC (AmiA/AmiB activator)
MIPLFTDREKRTVIGWVILIVAIVVVLIFIAIAASKFLAGCGGDTRPVGEVDLTEIKAESDAKMAQQKAAYERRIEDLEAEVAAIRGEIARIDREILESVVARDEVHDEINDATTFDEIDALIDDYVSGRRQYDGYISK